MAADPILETWVLVSLLTALYLLVRHWRDNASVGLLLTYVLSFGMLHWLAPALYLLPWYAKPGIALTIDGLRQSTFALLGFAAGAEIVAWLLGRRQPSARPAETDRAIEPRLVTMYLGVGAVLYGLVAPLASRIPSITAIVASGSTLIVVGLALKCWNNWLSGSRMRVYLWLAASCLLPFVTVVVQGFLGFGFAAMLTIFMFVASFYRPRWRAVAAGVLLSYIGLSVYVTYMRDRKDIRDVVWAGAGFEDRLGQLSATLADAEWFDWNNPSHLDRIDERLNQDYLIGAAVVHLSGGAAQFAHGETILDAVAAVVPRAIWPDKPVVAGSGTLVTRFTGIVFPEGTSVGIGQVMEWYVNFGTAGVLGGFCVIGGLLLLVDRFAARWLLQGDLRRFTFWYLPGLSLLQIGGSFVEVTSTAAAALVVAFILGHVTGRDTRRTARLTASVPVDEGGASR